MSLDTVRVSQQGKEQLIKLKRLTGIKQWNVLCRWALCMSLADPTPPLVRDVVTDSNVEMTWKTFGGSWAETYLALVKQRASGEERSTSPDAIRRTLTSHLHRGLGVLAGGGTASISDLTNAGASARKPFGNADGTQPRDDA